MDPRPATIVDEDDHEHAVSALVDGDRLLLSTADLPAATGWSRKPEGLCRDEVCLPVQLHPGLTATGPDGAEVVDVAALARAADRLAVVDADAGVAVLGLPARVRAERLRSLDAPGFAVTDLDGETVELADFRGRKKLLVAFASW